MNGDAAGLLERLAIREVVENWAVFRDAGDWERFRACWHDDGKMMATWFQGSADEFIAVSKAGFERGVSILHFLGGSSIEVKGECAIAQTKMAISQRAALGKSGCTLSVSRGGMGAFTLSSATVCVVAAIAAS